MHISDQGFASPALGLRPRVIHHPAQEVAPSTGSGRGSGHPSHARPVVFAMIGPWDGRDTLTGMGKIPIGLKTVGSP